MNSLRNTSTTKDIKLSILNLEDSSVNTGGTDEENKEKEKRIKELKFILI